MRVSAVAGFECDFCFLFFFLLMKGQEQLDDSVHHKRLIAGPTSPTSPSEDKHRSGKPSHSRLMGKDRSAHQTEPGFLLKLRRNFPHSTSAKKKASILFKNESYSHSSRPNSRPDNLRAAITRDIIARDGNGLLRHLSPVLLRRPRALTDKQMKYFARDEAPF